MAPGYAIPLLPMGGGAQGADSPPPYFTVALSGLPGRPQVRGAPGRSPSHPGKKLKAPGQEGPGRPGARASELPVPAQVLPLTRVCLSVGEERASTRSFGQILSIRSCSIWRGMGEGRVGGAGRETEAQRREGTCLDHWALSGTLAGCWSFMHVRASQLPIQSPAL